MARFRTCGREDVQIQGVERAPDEGLARDARGGPQPAAAVFRAPEDPSMCVRIRFGVAAPDFPSGRLPNRRFAVWISAS